MRWCWLARWLNTHDSPQAYLMSICCRKVISPIANHFSCWPISDFYALVTTATVLKLLPCLRKRANCLHSWKEFWKVKVQRKRMRRNMKHNCIHLVGPVVTLIPQCIFSVEQDTWAGLLCLNQPCTQMSHRWVQTCHETDSVADILEEMQTWVWIDQI